MAPWHNDVAWPTVAAQAPAGPAGHGVGKIREDTLADVTPLLPAPADATLLLAAPADATAVLPPSPPPAFYTPCLSAKIAA